MLPPSGQKINLCSINAKSYNNIWQYSPNFVATVYKRPFLFQHDNPLMHKAKFIMKFGVEEGVWPAQSPDLNSIQHLWDEMKQRLRARLYHPTSVANLTNAFVAKWEQNPCSLFPKSCEKSSQKSGGWYCIAGNKCPWFWNEMFNHIWLQCSGIHILLVMRCMQFVLVLMLLSINKCGLTHILVNIYEVWQIRCRECSLLLL